VGMFISSSRIHKKLLKSASSSSLLPSSTKQ
jgi:hypothetical protein